ncbi:MAG TPA: hypothetical protein VG676_02830 [Chitinophagaceae bacterium]|jgi:hypothetical protein|nr:hypothetical protein [Chitinophagaceae bacterium]
MAELSLWLDYYDDIYSDFDSRNYLKRRVSEDFLYELKNALKYKKERINDLILLLPQGKRDEPNEHALSESLKNFFVTQFQNQAEQCRHKLNRGMLLGITGILLMILNSMISFKGIHSFSLTVLRVLMEPAGWFLLWASFDSLFYQWKELKKEREFFRELSEMNIHFKSS